MQRGIWQRALAFLGAALVVVFLPHVVPRGWVTGDLELIWRGGVTAAWVVVSWGMIRATRQQGLRNVREATAERQGLMHFSIQMLSGSLVIIAVVVVLGIWQVNLTGVALGGALTGVVVGLAAQTTLSNVISGIQLLSLRPMRIGEWVTVRSWMTGVDVSGRIEEINFFYTLLRDGGTRRVVPNAALTVATMAVDESQQADVQLLVLPYRLPPEEAKTLLAPYRTAVVTELRADCYALRVEWPVGDSGHSERCAIVAARLAEA